MVRVQESQGNMEEEVRAALNTEKEEKRGRKAKASGPVKKIRTLSVLTNEESYEELNKSSEYPRSPRIVMNKNVGHSGKGRTPMTRTHYKR